MNLFAILLGAAAIAYGVAKYFRLPSVPVLIATGMSLSLSGLVPTELRLGNSAGSMNMLELGLVFLVFSSGVEMNPKRFRKYTIAVFWVAGIQFLLAMGVGFLCAKWMGVKTLESIYIGGGLAASSTLVVLRHLQMRKAMFEPYGRVVTGVLLLQDVALVLLIVLLSRVDGGGGMSGEGFSKFCCWVAWRGWRSGS